MTGEERLIAFAEKNYERKIWKINSRIYYVTAYGHSNCTVILGDTSVILIDTLDSKQRGEILKKEIAKITDMPVKTIIFTHGHPDHRGGSGAFRSTVEEVIGFAPKQKPLPYYERIQDVLNQRGAYQFGYGQTDEEAICQGIGIREGRADGKEAYDFLEVTTVYQEDEICRNLDGVSLRMVRTPGECDDQILIWLEEDRVICTGDTYYGCWPNLYAIRGTQYRDVATWVESLERILTFPAKVLLPGHLKPLMDEEEIRQVVGTFKDALQSVLFQTLDCINRGMTAAQAADTVKLPKEYADAEFLGEYYGTIQWSVKGIYAGYVGWFDGKAVNLLPVPEQEYRDALLALIGDPVKVVEQARTCIKDNHPQMALQLLDLLRGEAENDMVKDMKRKALLARARQVTSANARHYYIASAKA